MTANSELEEIKAEIEAIKARNKRVEADKAWETSGTRTFFIAIITFLLAFLFMILVGETEPFWKALIGTVAYLASTASYGVLKERWLAKRKV